MAQKAGIEQIQHALSAVFWGERIVLDEVSVTASRQMKYAEFGRCAQHRTELRRNDPARNEPRLVVED